MDHDVRFRDATPEDAATIVRLVRELAAFEDLSDEVRITQTDVLRDGFGTERRFECLLVEIDGKAEGFALFFHNYSTFEGRAGVFVEDLYLAPAARGLGLGRKLMARLARIAVERGCPRLDLQVLDWNPARGFYDRLDFHHHEGWLPYRLTGDGLAQLAAEADGR